MSITIAGIAGFLTINNQATDLTVVPVLVPIKGLPGGLDGFRIVQMTDFHLYPYTTPELVSRAVEMANSLQPDLTVLTGDYVWQDRDGANDLAAILSGLNARHGVYSVMGNHDIWLDPQLVKDAFHKYGLPMLVNQGLSITQNNGSLWLAGLDDGQSGNPDLNSALDGMPANSPVVLLYHEPDLADEVSLDGRVSLQLAGHTHGGQVRINGDQPFILPYLGRKYDLGLYDVNGMALYTNPGIGMISVPVRYNCPPEITEITLVMA